MTADLIQGTAEWLAARCGSLGASAMGDVLAKTKSGWGASRDNVESRLITERLTGNPADSFSNAAMQWGNDQEPNARAAYSFVQGVSVVEVGLFTHPTIKGTHASPDGFVGDDGMVEIKCPNSSTHQKTLLSAPIEDRYIKQMQWQMACTGRQWCDFASYDPRWPVEMQMHIRRVERDDAMIADMERDIAEFLAGVDAKVEALIAQYRREAA